LQFGATDAAALADFEVVRFENERNICDISIYRRMAKIEQKMVSNNTNASKSRKWF